MCNVLIPPAVNPIAVNKYIILYTYITMYAVIVSKWQHYLSFCIGSYSQHLNPEFSCGVPPVGCPPAVLLKKEWTWLHLATIYVPSASLLLYPPVVTCILPFILSTSYLSWCSWYFIGVNGGEVALQIGWVRRQPAWAHQPCSLFSWPRNNLLL